MLRKNHCKPVYLKAQKHEENGKNEELGLFFETIEPLTQIVLLRCPLKSEIIFQIHFLFKLSSFSHYIFYNIMDVGGGDRSQVTLE